MVRDPSHHLCQCENKFSTGTSQNSVASRGLIVDQQFSSAQEKVQKKKKTQVVEDSQTYYSHR